MFRRAPQLTFKRFNSHGHGYGVSKLISEAAYAPAKVNKAAGEAFVKNYEEKVHHSEGITKLWKRITYLIAIPAVLITSIPVGNVELKHAEHREHLKHLTDEEWQVQYDYQNLRQHRFFWGDGDKTLFWNSDVNRHIQAD
ncbi:cytochrome c oxidase subunit VIa [Scheffersomyces stipitis CBS 6054]|uniref:Cytochrome c oxidase subunit 13, mitochondrial n=1 Tax=Scheffersomyces stipitis (strain ATCC 58785 / CBS 6054 / NBRC 10063 / NRRL Y-11545) TaxID=322104 RepID=A3LRP3_PICST|nr:cytochrome c oxidase subunit VIa [Scheffersomyces stipitis CBS 6054]ABN65771.1 cytochrome c oxidase subunit VIa [Scheffersomyces stipitis CBS 6054]KAG2733667.1 hypothetical protein G9P44_003192 [Scheffersomyces stipitis]